jgi:hypothetical protein
MEEINNVTMNVKKNKKNNNMNVTITNNENVVMNNNINNINNKKNTTTNNKKENKPKNEVKKGEKRTFRLADPLIVYKELHGRAVKSKDPRGKYSDITPGGAARKMFRRIARSRQLEKFVEDGKVTQNGKINKTVKVSNVVKGADKNIVFSMVELDKDGSDLKRFYYKGSNKLDEPIMDKFIGFNKKTGKKKTSVQYIVPSITSITKDEYESKIKNQM